MRKGAPLSEEEIDQIAHMCVFVQADRAYRLMLQHKKHYIIVKLAHTLYEQLMNDEIDYETVLTYEQHVYNHVLDFLEQNTALMEEMRKWEQENHEVRLGELKKAATHAAHDLIHLCLPRAQIKSHFGLKKSLTAVEKMLMHLDLPWINKYKEWETCFNNNLVRASHLMMGSCRNCGMQQAPLRCSKCRVCRFCNKACWEMHKKDKQKRHEKWECELMQKWRDKL